jgi:SnoaL-like polyketide cyclase
MDAARMREFATRYTAAWCSQDAASVASFFAANGSLKINNGSESVGRAAVTSAAEEFMTDFPDRVVKMDELSLDGDHIIYRWTLTGTNTGPGVAGNAVCISGSIRQITSRARSAAVELDELVLPTASDSIRFQDEFLSSTIFRFGRDSRWLV